MPNYTVTVSFNINGGSGSAVSPASKTVASNDNAVSVSVNLANPAWSKTGHTLRGWATSASGGVSYPLGGIYTYMFAYTTFDQTHSRTLYAVWQKNRYTVAYNANGGSGAPASQTKLYGETLTLSDVVPTRDGYTFLGWSTSASGAVEYDPEDSYTENSNVTLYAVWKKQVSDIEFTTAAVVGSSVTIRITANEANAVNKLTYQCGSASGTIAENIAGAATVGGYVDQLWTIPASLANQAPNASYVNLTVVCETTVGGSSVGSSVIQETATIPNASPFQMSVSLVAEIINDNATIDGWGVAVNGFSKIKLTASATAQYGASVTSYTFSGPNFFDVESTSAASANVTTDVITVDGTLSYQVKVYDSRGFAKTATVTVTAYPYSAPAIESFTAYRSDANGDEDPVEGRRLSASVKYSVASCGGNNTAHAILSYRRDIDASFTTWQNNAVSEQLYTLATDILIANAYEVRVQLTDDLGLTTFVQSIQVASVVGIALGLYNDRFRLGGPCRIAGFECDWDSRFHGRIFAPNHAQRGFASVVTVAAGGSSDRTITFPDAFDIAPNVVATLYESQSGVGNCSISVYGITATQFNLRIENNNSADVSVGAVWIAIL